MERSTWTVISPFWTEICARAGWESAPNPPVERLGLAPSSAGRVNVMLVGVLTLTRLLPGIESSFKSPLSGRGMEKSLRAEEIRVRMSRSEVGRTSITDALRFALKKSF